MAKRTLGEGRRIRAKDLFTLFTGLWGHEEFEACGHWLIKIDLGSVLADYQEGIPDMVKFKANKFGLVCDHYGKHRYMHSDNYTSPVYEFDTSKTPNLRALYKEMLRQVNKSGGKKLNVSWNILKFVTLGPEGHRCYWERSNIGSLKDPVWIPLLIKVDKINARELSINEQSAIVGDDFFGGICTLEEKTIPSLACAGI